VTYNSREKYWQQLCTYLNDPAAAALASKELRANIIKHHTSDGWRTSLNEAYTRALIQARTRPHDRSAAVEDYANAADEILLAMQGGFIGNPPDPSAYFTARKKRGLLSRINRSLKKRIRSSGRPN
jgi:hypothetical protein